MSFVNPYAFVGTPDEVSRGRPLGHDRLGETSLSGFLDVTFTSRAPLLLGAVQDSGCQPPRRSVDGQMFVPGSMLHGASRAVHEVLTGSCLRVVDLDYRPVHRVAATAGATAGLRLAVVDTVEQGRPTGVRVARQDGTMPSTVWFRASDLLAGWAQSAEVTRQMRSGDQFSVVGGRPELKGTRLVWSGGRVEWAAPAGGQLGTGDGAAWRVLLTDTAARDRSLSSSKVYFVAGRNFEEFAAVPDRVWSMYVAAAADSNDVRIARRGEPGPEFPPVYWPADGPNKRLIGERYRVRPEMSVGQIVWVMLDPSGEVSELRPSQLWRRQGLGPVAERVKSDLHPCYRWDRLCPSCQLFGSADTRVVDRRTGARLDRSVAEQHSYAGHVRFSDAIASGNPATTQWRLAPRSSPHPSAGQFYLNHDAVGRSRLTGDGRQPLGQWGSAADTPNYRPIRGRKFYWRTENPEGGTFPRGRARDWQEQSALVQDVALIDTGAQFGFRVSFDNLTPAQIGGLASSLAPSLLFPDRGREVVTSIGGGKAFGFGAVKATVELTVAQTARDRYLGNKDQKTPLTLEKAVEQFASAVSPSARRLWPELRAVLTMGAVDNNDVWYPPGTAGPRGSEAYDQGFDFWSLSSGTSTREHGKTRLVGPPSPSLTVDQRIAEDAPIEKRPK